MLMWAHYASYHQGFCVEYDLSNIEPLDYRKRFLFPVTYSDDVFDATEHYKKDMDDENYNNIYLARAALVKAKDWQYEKEWRTGKYTDSL